MLQLAELAARVQPQAVRQTTEAATQQDQTPEGQIQKVQTRVVATPTVMAEDEVLIKHCGQDTQDCWKVGAGCRVMQRVRHGRSMGAGGSGSSSLATLWKNWVVVKLKFDRLLPCPAFGA